MVSFACGRIIQILLSTLPFGAPPQRGDLWIKDIFQIAIAVRWDVEDQQWILSHDPKCGHHTVGLKGFFQKVKLCRKYTPEEALAMERPVFSLLKSDGAPVLPADTGRTGTSFLPGHAMSSTCGKRVTTVFSEEMIGSSLSVQSGFSRGTSRGCSSIKQAGLVVRNRSLSGFMIHDGR